MSDQEPTVGEEVNEAVRNMLPWLSSLLLHAAVVVLAVFAAWSYVVMPETTAVIRPAVMLMPVDSFELKPVADPIGPLVQPDVRKVETEVADPTGQIDTGEVNKLKFDFTRVAPGPDDFVHGGKPDLSKRWLHGGNALRIVYVIDASGSLVDTLPFVIQELKKCIREMRVPQEFTVIFFQAGDAIEVPPAGYKQAQEEMRKQVSDWITLEKGNLVPRGSSSPLKALELAMRYRPQLLFVLSDNITGRGRYEVDRAQMLEMLRQANPVVDPSTGRRRTTINTIQFLYPDPHDTLREIAREHGGVFRQVGESDLGLR